LGWGKKITTPARIAISQLCPKNSDLKFESNTKGVSIIRFPVAGDSVNPEADLISDLGWWNRQIRLGSTFSASTVFKLPNGTDRSFDAAEIQRQRWEALTPAERRKFPPIAPDFVIELRQLMLCPCCQKKCKSI
jgi:Uma2 family endonuclease